MLGGIAVGAVATLAGCSGGSSTDDQADGTPTATPDDDTSSSSSQTAETDCSDAIRILSEFEDFPDGGTYPEGEPSEAKLQISFENTADRAVEYRINATFIEFSTARERDAGTTTGTLPSGGTESHEFVYEGSPQTIVEIDDYELSVESVCA